MSATQAFSRFGDDGGVGLVDGEDEVYAGREVPVQRPAL
jgi:hypothetical protein